MKRKSLILSLIILAAVVFSACGGGGPAIIGQEVNIDEGSYWNITSAQLKEMLEDKDFLFINVHIPYAGEIADTDLFIPYNEIEQNLSQLPQDRSAKIVLYCRSEIMSVIAAVLLVEQGYTNVWQLAAGMLEWERQGYQLLNKIDEGS